MLKTYTSEDYNFVFNVSNGNFARWGKTYEDDPEFSPIGPEILDIEVSTICSKGCSHCYKSNTNSGDNMSLETFTRIFKLFPKTLTQIAFGVGDIDANPDLYDMFKLCRKHNVVPNLTINGERMNDYHYDMISSLCGATAVSLYDKDTTYFAVKELADRGMQQVNIHSLLSYETFDKCMEVLKDSQTDPRLEKLNAIVFLWLKPKGVRNKHSQVNQLQYEHLVNYALSNNVRFGFDSCSAPMFLHAVRNHKSYQQFETVCEPCESTLFSYYINTQGFGFPCSFSENTENYKGVDVANATNFIKDVWEAPETLKFRDIVISNKDENRCRTCQVYSLGYTTKEK